MGPASRGRGIPSSPLLLLLLLAAAVPASTAVGSSSDVAVSKRPASGGIRAEGGDDDDAQRLAAKQRFLKRSGRGREGGGQAVPPADRGGYTCADTNLVLRDTHPLPDGLAGCLAAHGAASGNGGRNASSCPAERCVGQLQSRVGSYL